MNPLDHVSIDVLSLPVTDKGNRKALVAIDLLTKFAEMLKCVGTLNADIRLDPDAIRKLPKIPKKKEKSPVPDSMKDAGPTPRDQSETADQLMHRVIKIIAWVPTR